MPEPRVRALVLAAGRGERLRPLTATIPKPLLPAVGQCVAAYSLVRLQTVGCEAAVLNLHHLGERIRDTFGDRWNGVRLRYSEEPELLGTLGALVPLREFFRDCDAAFLLNGDSLCRWPLRAMLRRHRRSGALATVLVARRAGIAQHGGGIGLDRDERVVQFRATGPRRGEVHHRSVFAGAHVLSPEILRRLPTEATFSDIVGDLYQPLLAAGGHFQALSTRRAWHDLGTPERYLDGVCDWARGRRPLRWVRSNWVSAGAHVGGRVRMRGVAVEAGAVVERGARLEESVVLAGARVGAGSRLRHTILGPGVALPPRSNVEGRMVTPLAAGRARQSGDSVLGQLVFTPIG